MNDYTGFRNRTPTIRPSGRWDRLCGELFAILLEVHSPRDVGLFFLVLCGVLESLHEGFGVRIVADARQFYFLSTMLSPK